MGRVRAVARIVSLLCLAWWASGAAVIDEAGLVRLVLPRMPAVGEAVWIEVLAALPPLARLRLSTQNGVSVGSAGAFPPSRTTELQSYEFVLPEEALAGGEVRLRVEVVPAGGAPRAPLPGEVDNVELKYKGVTR
jgi:hypothetical protein